MDVDWTYGTLQISRVLSSVVPIHVRPSTCICVSIYIIHTCLSMCSDLTRRLRKCYGRNSSAAERRGRHWPWAIGLHSVLTLRLFFLKTFWMKRLLPSFLLSLLPLLDQLSLCLSGVIIGISAKTFTRFRRTPKMYVQQTTRAEDFLPSPNSTYLFELFLLWLAFSSSFSLLDMSMRV